MLGFAGFAFIALLPVHPTAAGTAAGVAAVAGVVVAVVTSTVVEVRDGELRVGRAHIPVSDLAVRAAQAGQAAHSVQTS